MRQGRGYTRRSLLKWSVTSGVAAAVAPWVRGAEIGEDSFDFHRRIPSPVKIQSIDVLKTPHGHFIRVRSADGAEGLAITNDRLADLLSLLKRRIIPHFVRKDARDVPSLLESVYTIQSNYKYAGLAFWCCVGFVEFALMDLMGKTAGKSVGQMLGGVVRKEVPVYMSSMRRDTTPEQEVEWVGKRLAETGAKAVKLKIGGRMSRNADASPGRTEKLVALARKTFGDEVTIYVDANGSYDAARAIEVGRMLEAHNVAFFEEPCPWEEYEETKETADALKIPIAGGEQDTSLPRFRRMVRDRVVDIVQPDVNYNGGFLRTIAVADMAAKKGMPITPHSPKSDPNEAYVLHLISRTPNAGPFHEYDAAPRRKNDWFEPSLAVKDGMIQVPTGPGLGIRIDSAIISKAQTL